MTEKLTDEKKAENKANRKVNQKVKCPVCLKRVEVEKSEDFYLGVCPNCGHPFRPKDLGIKPEE